MSDSPAWPPSDDGRGSGGGTEGGAGGTQTEGGIPPTPSGSEPPAPAPSQPPKWAADLQGGISELTGVMRGLMQMAHQNNQQQAAQAAAIADAPVDPAKLETLSRQEFSDHIVNQVLRAVNKTVVEPLRGELQAITANTTKGELQRAVEHSAQAHKDFGDWRDEMIQLAGQYRGLPPEALYHLARAGNSSKAGELDRRYNPPPPRAERPRFGGLTPSQSGTGNRGQRMNSKEASDAAWAEAVKGVGGEPLFDEE